MSRNGVSGSHLYAIAGNVTRRVKIGSAKDVRLRLATIRTMSADEVVLVGIARRWGSRENEVHTALQPWRQHGEWFAPAVTDSILSAKGDDSDPHWLERWLRTVLEADGIPAELGAARGPGGHEIVTTDRALGAAYVRVAAGLGVGR